MLSTGALGLYDESLKLETSGSAEGSKWVEAAAVEKERVRGRAQTPRPVTGVRISLSPKQGKPLLH